MAANGYSYGRLEYTSVQGHFLQDDSTIDPKSFDHAGLTVSCVVSHIDVDLDDYEFSAWAARAAIIHDEQERAAYRLVDSRKWVVAAQQSQRCRRSI